MVGLEEAQVEGSLHMGEMVIEEGMAEVEALMGISEEVEVASGEASEEVTGEAVLEEVGVDSGEDSEALMKEVEVMVEEGDPGEVILIPEVPIILMTGMTLKHMMIMINQLTVNMTSMRSPMTSMTNMKNLMINMKNHIHLINMKSHLNSMINLMTNMIEILKSMGNTQSHMKVNQAKERMGSLATQLLRSTAAMRKDTVHAVRTTTVAGHLQHPGHITIILLLFLPLIIIETGDKLYRDSSIVAINNCSIIY